LPPDPIVDFDVEAIMSPLVESHAKASAKPERSPGPLERQASMIEALVRRAR